jgi:2-dehydro-3-deoxygluconokinase
LGNIHESGQKSIYLKEALSTSQRIAEMFPKCKAVANTFRFDGHDAINYYATLYTGEEFFSSKEYNADAIVSKVGSGDCFMAGLIQGFYNNDDPQQVLQFATAAAFKKLFVASDSTTDTIEEITNTINYGQ